MRHLLATLLCLSLLPVLQVAAKELPLDIYNFLRVEYDDNVYTTGDGAAAEPVDSMVIIEQIEFLLDSQQGNTYYGLRYSPSFYYYTDRPDDDTDLNHQWDLILNHDFTPRTGMQFKHTLRKAEEPELVEDDVTFRNNNDYLYNAVDANISTQVVPDKTSVKARGRFVDFSYDEDTVAEINDYQEYQGGVDLIQVLSPDSTLTALFTYRELDYETDLRDGEIYRVGLYLSKVFNPKLQGTISGGFEQHNSDDPVAEDVDTPYVDASIVLIPVKGTRLTLGGGYALERSPVNTFSIQEMARVYGTLAQDLTAAMTFNLTGSLTDGNFDTDSATSLFDPAVNSDGSETTIRLVTSLNYRIGPRNSLELAYRYTELESDVRPGSDYDRNRVSLGWKYSL